MRVTLLEDSHIIRTATLIGFELESMDDHPPELWPKEFRDRKGIESKPYPYEGKLEWKVPEGVKK